MIEIRGIGISGKKASGTVYIFEKKAKKYHNSVKLDQPKEVEHLESIMAEAKSEIQCILDEAKKENNAWEIFESHQMLLDDIELKNYIMNLIKQGYDLLSALIRTKDDMKIHFQSMDSEIMQTKVNDIDDVFERLIDLESGIIDEVSYPKSPFILVCDEILPSMLYQVPQDNLKGIIVRFGSNCSHGAILARSRNIPVIIRLKNRIDLIKKDTKLIMNGESGTIFLLDE